jgi:GT2 family glycosyltransferase
MIDIVTVYHNETNKAQANELYDRLCDIEIDFTFFAHSNREKNLGFAKGCNIGASKGNSPIIGFLNPDVTVQGPFIKKVEKTLSQENVVITGCRFNKPDFELKLWGVKQWVCGAVFFVLRDWFELLGGFDERYVWSHEETDFIRQTELRNKIIKPIELPIEHASPDQDSFRDQSYKQKHFHQAQIEYAKKWAK